MFDKQRREALGTRRHRHDFVLPNAIFKNINDFCRFFRSSRDCLCSTLRIWARSETWCLCRHPSKRTRPPARTTSSPRHTTTHMCRDGTRGEAPGERTGNPRSPRCKQPIRSDHTCASSHVTSQETIFFFVDRRGCLLALFSKLLFSLHSIQLGKGKCYHLDWVSFVTRGIGFRILPTKG